MGKPSPLVEVARVNHALITRDSSSAARVIEPDAVVRPHAVQMPTLHNLAAWTFEIVAVKVHRVAATI